MLSFLIEELGVYIIHFKIKRKERRRTIMREKYRAILNRLPIEYPTQEDIMQLCPHLTQEQAITALSNEPSCVACPSLRIHGAFHVISFSSNRWLEIATTKTPHEYERELLEDKKFRSARPDEYPYAAEAIRFSEEHWGNELTIDAWMDAFEICVQDPLDLTTYGFPKTKVVLGICLICKRSSLGDHKPPSILLDESIVEMTLERAVWKELKGGRTVFTEFNCAFCGGGLHISWCDGCKHRFKDDFFRCGWSTPLSKKMVHILQESGHVFKQDPAIVWRTEELRHKIGI